MSKKLQAFTLIELMVVVAIIAILGTMSVANFSSSIRKTRNSVRVSDMQAAAKASETCYDALAGEYLWIPKDGAKDKMPVDGATAAADAGTGGAFSAAANNCLNKDVSPALSEYPYYWNSNPVHPQKFTVCAALEPVQGWESIGNSKLPDLNGYKTTECKEYADNLSFSVDDWCYYCVSQSQ